MQVHQIKRAHPLTKKKIIARGGKRGKTAGRGGKGQTARAGNKRRPAMRDIIKKLPKLRGHGKNRAKSVFVRGVFAVVNVGMLASFEKGATITPSLLVSSKIVRKASGKIPQIKILGKGEITIPVTISGCEVSQSAQAKIEKAGGKVIAPASEEVKKDDSKEE